jgi:putative ABC transport system substrate-binding protein
MPDRGGGAWGAVTSIATLASNCGYSGGMGTLTPPRRRFLRGGLTLVGLGLLAACGVVPPLAQAPRRTPRIGRVWAANVTPDLSEAFREQLRDLGHVDGQSVSIEDRVAGGQPEPLPGLVAELVRMPVDIIVTTGTPATLAAREATSTIPIVQASGTVDLVREGLAASLAQPGGNVTGLSATVEELTGKQLDLLRQVVPGLGRVAVLWNPVSPSTAFAWTETRAAALALGLEPQSLEVRSPEDLEGLMSATRGGQTQALLVLVDALTAAHRARIAELAQANRLPSMFDRREFAADGGLMAYGPNFVDMHRRAAVYVDKILKDAKPGDLPIERPTKFDFAINLKTASTLGLAIPQSVLYQATELIQ